MITVQYPTPDFRIKKKGEKPYIFDAIRKTWLLLTEEEWVRQNFVAYLITTLSYPKEAIALEKEILVNGLKKRFDILIYNHFHHPWLLVECKAPHVVLDETVLQQALNYHMAVPVDWILITNGEKTTGWKKEGEGLHLISALPNWNE